MDGMEQEIDAQAEARELGRLIGDADLALSVTSGALAAPELRGMRQLAEQGVRMGIDYASLGLGWHHPQSRIAYREAKHKSTACKASRQRAERTRQAIAAALRKLASIGDRAEDAAAAGAVIVALFAEEISACSAARAGATPGGVLAALEAELLLPLRALNEDRKADSSMARTFGGSPLPRAKIEAVVDEVTKHVLDGTFSEWRYTNPVGARQLEGLSEEQRRIWSEPGRSDMGDFVVHEDAPGELGFFWATKIGGPSHGFDYEGQCLLPLLANARHKVVMVSDPDWPHNPSGRAHLRLLWTEGGLPVMWLETVNVDFDAHVNTRPWSAAVLRHAVRKAEAMGAMLSVSSHHKGNLVDIGLDPSCLRDVCDRLVLRPSNAVVEASDYLGDHDWVQLGEEKTDPLHRAVYQPKASKGAADCERAKKVSRV